MDALVHNTETDLYRRLQCHDASGHACFTVSRDEPSPPRVAQILREHGPALLDAHPPKLIPDKARALNRLCDCRQPAMGSHAWHCKACGNTQVCYNGCHNRHCVACMAQTRAAWTEALLRWALPIDYLHIVFTLPHEFIPLGMANERTMYRLLFAAARTTLAELAKTHHAVRLGYVLVLHTWGQRMNLHVHVHCLVTTGGLTMDGSAWVPLNIESAAFDKTALTARFRQNYLDGLRRLFRRQKLSMPGSMAHVVDEPSLERWLRPVLAKTWQINVQPPPNACDGPSALVKYLARYVVGTAIRDKRILRYDGRCVVIGIKNYRTGNYEERRMTGDEFVGRFTYHILPRYFQRVRYCGIFAVPKRAEYLPICRAKLGLPESDAVNASAATTDNEPARATFDGDSDADVGRRWEAESSVPECRRCGMPGMVFDGVRWQTETALFLSYLSWLWGRLVTQVSTLDEPARAGRLTTVELLSVLEARTIDCIAIVNADELSDYHTATLECLPLPDT